MIKIQKYLVIAVFVFAAMPVFAARISFDAKTTQAQVGKNFEVALFVNTEQENINAFEGEIIFPNDLLDLKEIRDGNTIVNFWIDKPKVEADEIFFSGIIPGGFIGENGLILSMLFQAKKPGAGSIAIRDIKVLKNDGAGSAAEAITSDFRFSIVGKASAIVHKKEKDRESPETFRPEIARDESLFDGKWFLVFATQDKKSGIDHYEVKETRQGTLTMFSKWIPAESPYVLQDQGLRSYVFVKAVDKERNARVTKVSPQNPLGWYENYENWFIIVLGLIIVFAVRKFYGE